MNMQLKRCNSIAYRKNINTNIIQKNNLIKNDYELDMDFALKSINNPQLKFTNMLRRNPNKDANYAFLRKKYFENKNKKMDLISEFEIVELEYKSESKKERFHKLLNQTHNNIFSTLPAMIKCKYFDNKAFQLFAEWIDKNHVRVNFIDVHHLVFPTPNKERGEKTVNLTEKYNELKDYSVCLSKIKSQR